MGFVPVQDDFTLILGGFSACFIAYAFALKQIKNKPECFHYWMSVGILARFLLIFSLPNLSDDIFRFIWDGNLIHEGIHPLKFTPDELMAQSLGDSWSEVYHKLNSKNYYTIYPPVAQLLFYISSFTGISSLATSIIIFKSMLFLSELGVLFFLLRLLNDLDLARWFSMLYFLNPLIIIESIGNAHFESLCIFFLLASFYCLKKKKLLVSSALFSLSIATKLLPIMFLPIFIIYFKDRKRLFNYYAGITLFTTLLFIPFLMGLDLLNFLSSLDLYFQRFEFNASLYFILRWLGKLITGYNQIWLLGPFLTISAIFVMVRILFRKKFINEFKGLIHVSFLFFLTYLLFATTIHPWYLSFPIVLMVFKPRLYVLVWSFTVIFSYALYNSYIQDISPITWVYLEYMIVGLVYYFEVVKRGLSWT